MSTQITAAPDGRAKIDIRKPSKPQRDLPGLSMHLFSIKRFFEKSACENHQQVCVMDQTSSTCSWRSDINRKSSFLVFEENDLLDEHEAKNVWKQNPIFVPGNKMCPSKYCSQVTPVYLSYSIWKSRYSSSWFNMEIQLILGYLELFSKLWWIFALHGCKRPNEWDLAVLLIYKNLIKIY